MFTYSAASSFFGPDYQDAEAESIGTFDIKANSAPFDITFESMSILPPGGYLMRYIEGSYLIMTKVPTFLTIGGPDGLRVGWMSAKSQIWTVVPFNIDYKATDANDLKSHVNPSNSDSILQLELSRPHRIQLIPPQKAAGNVKIKVLRYSSKYLTQVTD